MKVWRSGTSVYSRASSRTSSSDGPTSIPASSAATAIEDLERIRQRQASRGQQHVEVIEHVGGLLAHALVRLVPRGPGALLALLLHLGPREGGIGKQARRVALARARAPPLGDRPLEHRQCLVRRPPELAVVEARALARVTGRTAGLDEREQRVGIAVVAQLADRLDVAAGLTLVPQLASRAAPEPGLAARLGAFERLAVHVREREHLTGVPVLDDDRREAALVEGDRVGVHHRAKSM